MDRRPTGAITVPFLATGAEGPLSWGQIESWNAVRTLGHWMPIGGALPVAPGTTLDDLAGEFRWHLDRHPTLRTVLRIPADGTTPTQVVRSTGRLTLPVYESGPDDPAALADALADELRATPLDFACELPVRAAVVVRGGVPSHLVALISHFATDGVGAQTMLRDVATRPAEPVAGRQPLDQAAWQASPAGRRQNDAAMRSFETVLRAMPPTPFRTPPPAPREARYWRGALDTAALPLALRLLADRHAADPPTLLLTVFALAVHRTFGTGPVVVRPLVSNRFRPGLADVVCTAVQAGLCLVPVEGLGFAGLLPVVARIAPMAYKHAYFDQRDLHALLARTARERGTPLEIGCFLNDRRDPAAFPPSPSPGAVAAALPSSAFTWLRRQPSPGFEPMILDVEDGPAGLRLTAHTDTACVAPGDTELLLRTIERVAVEAAIY